MPVEIDVALVTGGLGLLVAVIGGIANLGVAMAGIKAAREDLESKIDKESEARKEADRALKDLEEHKSVRARVFEAEFEAATAFRDLLLDYENAVRRVVESGGGHLADVAAQDLRAFHYRVDRQCHVVMTTCALRDSLVDAAKWAQNDVFTTLQEVESFVRLYEGPDERFLDDWDLSVRESYARVHAYFESYADYVREVHG